MSEDTTPYRTDADAPEAAPDSPEFQDALALEAEARREFPEAAAGRFAADTASKVDWVLKLIKAAHAEINEVQTNAAKIIARREAEIKTLHDRFDADLYAYAQAETQGKKVRYVDLLHGRVALRRNPARLTVLPEHRDDALAWAKTHLPAAVTFVPASEKVNIADVTKALRMNDAGYALDPETGEVVEWASVMPESETVTVK